MTLVALVSAKGSPGVTSLACGLEQQVWETEIGERRSRVEVTADEVRPSLRFATVEISRNERHAVADGDGESAGRRGSGTADVLGAEA